MFYNRTHIELGGIGILCFSGEDGLMYFIKCIQNCFACWENFKLPYPFFLLKWTYFIPCVFSDILQFESEIFSLLKLMVNWNVHQNMCWVQI